MKLSRSNMILGTIEKFSAELCFLDVDNSLQFTFVFFARNAYIEKKLGVQDCHDNIYVRFDSGYHRANFDRFMPHGLRKIQSLCTFRLFYLQSLYLL